MLPSEFDDAVRKGDLKAVRRAAPLPDPFAGKRRCSGQGTPSPQRERWWK